MTEESDGVTDGEFVLFQLTNDPYVNAGIAALTAELREHVDAVSVDGNRVVVEPDEVDETFNAMESLLFGNDGVVRYTHRPTSTARQVNKALGIEDSPEDANYIGQPREPFPEDATVYEDDEVDEDDLADLGIADEVDYDGSLYSKSPTYVGTPKGRYIGGRVDECREYLRLLQRALGDSQVDVDESACMACGREELPNWKVDDDIEYGQQYTPVTTKAASQQPLGQKSNQETWYRGRCVACLVAGFYYTFTPNKPVSPIGREYRVFVPEAPLERLTDIHKRFDDGLLNDITKPTSNGYARRSTLPGDRTESKGLQAAKMAEQMVRAFRREKDSGGGLMSGVEFETDPVTIRYYTTTDSKSGRPVRGFSSFGTVGDGDRMYEAMGPFEDDEGTHWPYESVLSWFAHLDDPSADGETLVGAKDDIALGVLEAAPNRIGRGMVDVAKALGRDAQVRYPPSIARASNYFTKLFTGMTDNLDEDTIESISSVATTLGRTFGGEVSHVITLQNASSPEQFMRALESVGVDALKKSVAEGSDGYVWHEDAQDVIAAVTDEETFPMAKQAFVTQAALAAQYQYSQENTADANGDQNE